VICPGPSRGKMIKKTAEIKTRKKEKPAKPQTSTAINTC